VPGGRLPSLCAACAALLLALSPAPPVSPAPPENLVRRLVAEAALAQAEAIDPAWQPAQRDCAGLVRFAFRTAFRKLAPERVERGLWVDAAGRHIAFADAATLVRYNFALLGRDEQARRGLRSGDLVAFSRPGDGGDGEEPVSHLMLVVRTDDPAHFRPAVVYHPGQPGVPVRVGALDELIRDAPAAWRPVPENPAFLGFFRLKEWMP
jgi:uncharacterized protein YfaT (DUF1175 family)